MKTKELTEEEKRVVDAFANLVRVDVKVYNTNRLPILGYVGLIRAISESLKLSTEETKILLNSAIEKNSSEFVSYFSKHSF